MDTDIDFRPAAITLNHLAASGLKQEKGVYLEISLGNEKVATKACRPGGGPLSAEHKGRCHWMETFKLPSLNKDAKILQVKAYSHHTFLPDHLIGEGEEPLDTLVELGASHNGGTVRMPLNKKGEEAGEVSFLVHTILVEGRESEDTHVDAVAGYGGGGATVVSEEAERKSAEKGFTDPSLHHSTQEPHVYGATTRTTK